MPDLALDLPPAIVEELPPPAPEKPAPPPQEQPGQAVEVAGADLLKTPPQSAPNEPEKPKVSPWQGKGGKHPKDCYCTTCTRTRKIKELVDGVKPEAGPSAAPQAPWDDIPLPPDLAAKQTPPTPGGAPPLAAPEPRPDYLLLAKTTFALSEGIMQGLMGPEWKRDSDEEMMTIAVPLAVVYERNGMTDLPPGYLLCFSIAAYSMKRVNKPATKSKLQVAWYWIKSKFGRKKQQQVQQTAEPKKET